MSYLRYWCLLGYVVVTDTYCVVCLFCFSSFCVPYAARFSGLSILGCPFGILWRFIYCNYCWDFLSYEML